jgi:transmembrane sensor
MQNDSTYLTDLITRYFSGEATSEEIIALSGLLKSDPENQKLFDEYKNTWNLVEQENIETSVDIDTEWSKISSKIDFAAEEKEETKIFKLVPDEKPKRNFYYQLLKIAAVFILLAVSAIFIFNYLNKTEDKKMVAENKSVEGTLPDGSSVTLNSGSTLEYPDKFDKNKRSVKLNGEAYFNVKHDETKPFIISADDVMVEVLGTSFYVNTNAANGMVEVILTSGKVAVYYKDKPSEKVILQPGEKAEFSKTSQIITKSANENENYMAWKTKKMVFNNEKLADIIQVLNKVYLSDIRLKNNNMADCRVTASFDNQSLDAVLNVLKATVDLNINKTGSSIELSGNGCK